MSLEKTPHNAAQSAVGYLYQARLALAECLKYVYSDSEVEIAVEKFDDVSFEKNGQPIDLLQTKHHLGKAGDLTDASVDLWKTIGIWSEATRDDPSLPGRTRFALVTTAQAPDGSAASCLRATAEGNEGRDVGTAETLLLAVASVSQNAALKKAFAAFSGLAPGIRNALLHSIEVFDRSPMIVGLEGIIEQRLKMLAPRGKVGFAREQLEGWWWPRICAALSAAGPGVISVLEVEQKLDDIRDSLKRDGLPLDMEDVDPPEQELENYEQMRFVRQLGAIGVRLRRLHFAKRDFYRAFSQRSQWTRQNLLFDGEVARFERTLIEEWQPRFSKMSDGIEEGCQDSELRKAGQELYHWVESEARFPFRSTTSRFLNVGSYHMLANDMRIGWHRDFEALLAHDVDEEL